MASFGARRERVVTLYSVGDGEGSITIGPHLPPLFGHLFPLPILGEGRGWGEGEVWLKHSQAPPTLNRGNRHRAKDPGAHESLSRLMPPLTILPETLGPALTIHTVPNSALLLRESPRGKSYPVNWEALFAPFAGLTPPQAGLTTRDGRGLARHRAAGEVGLRPP